MGKESVVKFFIGFFIIVAALFIFASFCKIVIMKTGGSFFSSGFDFFIFTIYLYLSFQMYCYLPEKPRNNSNYYSILTLVFFFSTMGAFSVLISNFVI